MFSQLPMYQRVGKSAFKKDLKNIRKLCKAIGNPQNQFASIHIAGTNGKGSTAHQLAAVLQKASYKVGLYTSPHYVDFRERIKINGACMSENEVVAFVHDYHELMQSITPSFFEITVAMAFDHFHRHEVDFAIVETGLGGRLDSTNILKPILSIITNVSFDHQNMLGDTIEKIAVEKAGIIKKDTPIVLGEYDHSYAKIMEQKAAQMNAPISMASKNFRITLNKEHSFKQQINIKRKGRSYLELNIPKKGNYQWKNMITVLQSVAILKSYHKITIPKIALKEGLENYPKLTSFIGRWEVVSKKPLTILDSAHNIAGIKEALIATAQIKFDKLHIIMGFVKDKELKDVLSQFPQSASYYFSQAKIPRALEADVLKEEASDHDLKGRSYKKVKNALKAAEKKASSKDLILVIGSIFLIGELLQK